MLVGFELWELLRLRTYLAKDLIVMFFGEEFFQYWLKFKKYLTHFKLKEVLAGNESIRFQPHLLVKKLVVNGRTFWLYQCSSFN